jgi:hypothetical protein
MLSLTASPSFSRIAKKLHAKDQQVLDNAIQWIAANHQSGEEQKGDLAGVFVYKFKPSELVLLALGPHDNFYAALKR